MNLELKHLAPYLAHDLKVYKINENHIQSIYAASFRGVYFIDDRLNARHGYSEIKPILRPLSDLNKEIEVNGERFVPLYELFKISLGNVNLKKLPTEFTTKTVDGTINLYCADFLFGYDKLDSSFCLVLKNTSMIINNQYELFTKLFEWHFDVFGLIPAGLAIDINTIDQCTKQSS